MLFNLITSAGLTNPKRLLSSGAAVIAALMLNACGSDTSNSDQNQTDTMPTLLVEQAAPSAPQALLDRDAHFSKPYIDIDEMRDAPVPHRYIHGGFSGTQTRFSYYFPPKDLYQGRFFQHITPVPLSENLAQEMPAGMYNKIGFSIDSGAYFVETNGGDDSTLASIGTSPQDPTITAYRANAAAAQYSRAVAQAIYQTDERPYGYAYGGSGGGYRTVGSAENTQGVWDGVVPYVLGSSMAIPNMFTVRMHAMRILQDNFPSIIDAVDAGGSDPYAGLTDLQRKAYTEVTRMGFPPESWYGYKTMGIHGFAALYGGVRMADPGYFTEFWTTPGYLGHDDPTAFDGYRIQFESKITELITAKQAAEANISTDASNTENRGGVDEAFTMSADEASKVVAFKLAATPPKVQFLGGDLVINSGSAEGKELTLAHIKEDIIVLGMNDQTLVDSLAVGDKVRVDNSNFLAVQTYHRHQVPGPDFPAWDQFRDAEGKPIYPQRPFLIGPMFVQNTVGSQMTGEVDEKVILVASLLDREAMPWQADWYLKRVQAYHGDKADDQVRLYYTDRALHGDQPQASEFTRIVSYQGMLQQALRDLAAWAEKGTPPPASDNYQIVDAQVVIPDNAQQRKGIQPVVNIHTGDSERIEVKAGEPVEFSGEITVPPGVGKVVAAEWDFDGSGEFATKVEVTPGKETVTVTTQYTFNQPGTYFVVLRGASHREGDMTTDYAKLYNLDRLRVVVQ
ncbi:hypothetical protein [Halioxenophilus aromaticivorans]|uniref:PKD domain-containing protein n=1 Tax=Halioxenophilus aromaticivorans TaxID=1306992 RepID=A0AAV3U8T9_9ALTE